MSKKRVACQYIFASLLPLINAIVFFVCYANFISAPCDTVVPLQTWVLVGGISFVATVLIGWLNFPESVAVSKLPCRKRCKQRPTTALGKAVSILFPTLFLFDFCWFIVGNVWVFGSGSSNCSVGLVGFIVGVLIGQWIVLSLAILIFLGLLPFLCCACCTTSCACCLKACCCEGDEDANDEEHA
jgi:hypothetical protein